MLAKKRYKVLLSLIVAGAFLSTLFGNTIYAGCGFGPIDSVSLTYCTPSDEVFFSCMPATAGGQMVTCAGGTTIYTNTCICTY